MLLALTLSLCVALNGKLINENSVLTGLQQGEVPSSKLRAKTIVLSRVVFNVSGFIINTLLPLMLTGGAWNLGAKTAFMFVSTIKSFQPVSNH